MSDKFRSARVIRKGDTIFIPLPPEMWASAGPCRCPYCDGAEAFWDTLAVVAVQRRPQDNYTWTVHSPEAHGRRVVRHGS